MNRDEGRPGGTTRIPVSWQGADGQVRSQGRVVGCASEEEIRRYGHQGRVCGECRHFEHGHGQHEMKVQRFMPKLVNDYEWKPEHLCAPVNQLGLCGQASGEDKVLTGPMHAACDQWRPDRGRLRTHTSRARREAPERLYSDGTAHRGGRDKDGGSR